MLDTQESKDFFTNLQKSLSPMRFGGYCQRGSNLDAFAKYLWNAQICESLYPCFQLLEVAFRNNVHAQTAAVIHDPTWILNQHGILYAEEQEAIKRAKEDLSVAGSPMTEDYLVSEMKFGFWTSLLNSRYDRLWHKIIVEVLPHMPKTSRTRADVSTIMNGVRRLRNAALHHHSIWHWADLRTRHNQMRQLIGHICSPSAAIAQEIDRFPTVYDKGIAECQKTVSKILRSVQKPAVPADPN